jgi:hypothetical protein
MKNNENTVYFLAWIDDQCDDRYRRFSVFLQLGNEMAEG